MQMPFVDAHLHLQDPRFKGKVNEVIGRAKNAGVGLFFCNAIKEEDWPEVTTLAAAHREIIPFLGIHPWFSDTAVSGWQHRLVAAAETLDQIIGIGDAICSQIDGLTYDTYVKDRHREIIDFIHQNGGLVKLHICGNITHILPSIKELGVDILDIDYQVDINETYDVIGPDIIRCGNINPVLVEERDAEEIYLATRTLIETQKGKKFILSAGCEITVNTKHENLMAMREASIF